MTLNGRPDRGLSNSKPSTAKRRTHRSTVVRACPVCCTIASIDSPCRCSWTSSARCCAVRRTMREPVKISSVAESERQPRTLSRMVAVAHTTMDVGMDNTTKTINQPLVRNRSNTTLDEVVGKVGILSKPSARKQTHTASARQPQPMLGLPHWAFRGGLHRTLAQPCSFNCVQTQTNH